ncbi:MAG: molecular chaperone HscC, partial [Planctomycetota bacterium]
MSTSGPDLSKSPGNTSQPRLGLLLVHTAAPDKNRRRLQHSDSSPSSALIGIDLGTTNSLCAIFVDGEAQLVPNAHGSFMTPSCVGMLEDGSMIVGDAAKELAVTRPERTAMQFKRWMGTDKDTLVGDKSFTAQDLSSLVLRSLCADAEARLGHKVTRAVISVPAYFNEHQREATRMAAELAGLEAQRIINEPTAAALTYGLVDKDQDKKILVLDLGGGTFDVTLMEVFEGTLEIVSTAGESHLGGEDFTERIVSWCLGRAGRVLEVAELQEPLRVARLRQQAEHAKRKLGTHDEVSLRLPSLDGTLSEESESFVLRSSEFAVLVEPLLLRLEKPLERVLRDGRSTPADVDEVILVGGATRMPQIGKFVHAWFEREPRCSLNPDEVVAQGAAIQAALIADDRSVEDLVMTDVCPFTMGVEITKEFGNMVRDGYFLP